MKNQFFGDVNDYRKYGLLRLLCKPSDINLAICWMLTPPDKDSRFGKKINYLADPNKYRKFDPVLYDTLSNLNIISGADRHVKKAKLFFPESCFFYEEMLSDNLEERSKYFDEFFNSAKRHNLLFFDPDIGMESKSVLLGKKNSSKYLYWGELLRASREGHSVVIYQHFHRKERVSFINSMLDDFRNRIGVQGIWTFKTANVVFFLLAQRHHFDIFSKQSEIISLNWNDQINLVLTKKDFDQIAHKEQSVSVEELDDWRRYIIRLVRQLEPKIPSDKRGIISRIRSLSQQHRIPGNVSDSMEYIVKTRNRAVYEEWSVVGAEAKAVRNAWEVVLKWTSNVHNKLFIRKF